jgi:hypothetical protein
MLEVSALRLSRDLAYIVGVAPINSTLCNTFHQKMGPVSFKTKEPDVGYLKPTQKEICPWVFGVEHVRK